jgi:hypothetical protein
LLGARLPRFRRDRSVNEWHQAADFVPEKKPAKSPQARIARASWAITLIVEMMIRTLTTQNSREKAQKAQKKGADQTAEL